MANIIDDEAWREIKEQLFDLCIKYGADKDCSIEYIKLMNQELESFIRHDARRKKGLY